MMSDLPTNPTLFDRMRKADTSNEAWLEFSKRYGEIMFRWAYRYFGNAEDANDIAQETMVKLFVAMTKDWSYDRNGSFRGLLRKVVRNTALTELRRRKKCPSTGGTANLIRINEIEAAEELGQLFDEEHQCEIMERAESFVKNDVNPDHWRVYEMAKDDVPPGEIASSVGMEYGNVKVILSRLRGQIKVEAARLNVESMRKDGETDGQAERFES